jgi:hypothetical protein
MLCSLQGVLLEDAGCMMFQTLTHKVGQLDVAPKHILYEMLHDAEVLSLNPFEPFDRFLKSFLVSSELCIVAFEPCIVNFGFRDNRHWCSHTARRLSLAFVVMFGAGLDGCRSSALAIAKVCGRVIPRWVTPRM